MEAIQSVVVGKKKKESSAIVQSSISDVCIGVVWGIWWSESKGEQWYVRWRETNAERKNTVGVSGGWKGFCTSGAVQARSNLNKRHSAGPKVNWHVTQSHIWPYLNLPCHYYFMLCGQFWLKMKSIPLPPGECPDTSCLLFVKFVLWTQFFNITIIKSVQPAVIGCFGTGSSTFFVWIDIFEAGGRGEWLKLVCMTFLALKGYSFSKFQDSTSDLFHKQLLKRVLFIILNKRRQSVSFSLHTKQAALTVAESDIGPFWTM